MTKLPMVPVVLALLAGCASTRGLAPQAPAAAVAPAVGIERAVARPSRRSAIHAALPQNVRVVVVVGGNAVRSASGVAVGTSTGPHGSVSYVLTNAHVVQPRGDEPHNYLVLVDLPTGDAQEFAAHVVAAGSVPDSDLAVLEVVGVRLEPAQLADDGEVSLGDDVFIVAAPYGRALSVSGGMISQVDFGKGLPRLPTMLKTDAAIGYGASGGGIFSTETGKLVGLVEGYRTAKVSIPLAQETYSFDVPMPGETFAAPAAKIRRFLAEKGLGKLVGSAAPTAPVADRTP